MQRRQGNANARNANGGRASVKNQRRVNSNQQPAPVRSNNKKKPQQKENAHKQPHNAPAPVGVSGVPLSARFSSLQKEAVVQQPVPAAKKKKNVVVNIKKTGQQLKQQPTKKGAKQQQKAQQLQKQQQQKQKMQVVAQANRTKRQETVNQRRKGLGVAAPPAKGGKKNSKAANGIAVAPKPKKKTPVKGKDEKKKPITGEDLDVEMDSYWHKAGKGPDPQQALLDRQMEDYWAGKPKHDGEEAPASETNSA